MKESDFWMSVAKKIENGEQISKTSDAFAPVLWGTKRDLGGLCYETDNCSDERERLYRHRPAKSVAYFFPLTPKGDRKRFRLCLKMAREAEREERRNDLEGTMQR